MRFIYLIISGFLLITSCTKGKVNPDADKPFSVSDTVITDVSYGQDVRHKLDIYLPEKRTSNTKLVILVHGGGWSSGDKKDMALFAQELQKQQFAVAGMNYRLSPQSQDNYKMQMDDIGKAISFLKSKAETYAISSGQIYLAGHSAGAHLSLSYAYTRNDGSIKAVCGMATPADLYHLSYYNGAVVDPMLISYLGGEREQIKQRYLDCSPNHQVKKGSVPTILFHGDLDFITPLDQVKLLEGTLKKFDVPVKLTSYPLMFHDWWAVRMFIEDTFHQLTAWFNLY